MNVLALPGTPDVFELGALGVSRVSVGGAFNSVAIAAVGGRRTRVPRRRHLRVLDEGRTRYAARRLRLRTVIPIERLPRDGGAVPAPTTDQAIVERFALTDRVAVVTGGNSGIGRGIAEAFARAGAKVALVARRKDLLDESAAEIDERCSRTGAAHPFSADLAQRGRRSLESATTSSRPSAPPQFS